MPQYVMSMRRVNKIVPPKRQIIKDISLSFFQGAKIGLLGLNGAGKSTVLRIMAGVDADVHRFYTADPFGNRIEIIQDGEGFAQRSEITRPFWSP